MQSYTFLFNIRAIALYYMYTHGTRRQLIVLINLTLIFEWQHLQHAVLNKKWMHLFTVLYTTTLSFVALVFCPSGLSLYSYIVDGIP